MFRTNEMFEPCQRHDSNLQSLAAFRGGVPAVQAQRSTLLWQRCVAGTVLTGAFTGLALYIDIQRDDAILPPCKDPGLGGVEGHGQLWHAAMQDLDGDDEGVGHQVRVHHSVEHLDQSVVGCRGKERV